MIPNQSEFDGKRVKLIKPHPHAGEYGTIIGQGRTPVGNGLIIQLDGTDQSCFAFNIDDFRWCE